MERSSPRTVTCLLKRWASGEPGAEDRLLPLIYGELRAIAGSRFRSENPGHTLQPTAVVHEAYLRLARRHEVDWKDRSHFLGFAARTMRHILVDHARSRDAKKRGGALKRASPTHLAIDPALTSADVLAVNEALHDLRRIDKKKAAIVELRVFAGLSLDETALALGASPSTVSRGWRMARAWLIDQLDRQGGSDR